MSTFLARLADKIAPIREDAPLSRLDLLDGLHPRTPRAPQIPTGHIPFPGDDPLDGRSWTTPDDAA